MEGSTPRLEARGGALGSGLPSHAMACLHDCPHGPLTLARIVQGLVEVPLVLDLGDYGKGP